MTVPMEYAEISSISKALDQPKRTSSTRRTRERSNRSTSSHMHFKTLGEMPCITLQTQKSLCSKPCKHFGSRTIQVIVFNQSPESGNIPMSYFLTPTFKLALMSVCSLALLRWRSKHALAFTEIPEIASHGCSSIAGDGTHDQSNFKAHRRGGISSTAYRW